MKKCSNNYKKHTTYISGIDGLRAIAVLMVFAYHLNFPSAKGGLLGVTVFFVISGFLITRKLISELENTNTIHLKLFWIKRMKRLLPAVLTMVTVVILVSAVFDRVLFTKACSDLLPSILGCNNWWQIFNHVSYFENAGVPSPFTHFWSLAIEVQFYLLYPLVLIVLAKVKNWKKIAICVTILLAAVSMGAMWSLSDLYKDDPSRVYYGTDTRVFSLLLGAFLAFIEKENWKGNRISSVLKNIIGIVSLIVLLYMISADGDGGSFYLKEGQGAASVCAVLVIFSFWGEESILNRALSALPLKWTGERSYGIYLWHYPLMLLISKGGKSPWWVSMAIIFLTCLVSSLSYKYIETPILRGKIKNSIDVIRTHPRTRMGYRKLIVWFATLLMVAGAFLCVAFVPRKNALSNIKDLEKQEEEAKAIVNQKTLQLEEEKKQKERARKTLSNQGQSRSEEEQEGEGKLSQDKEKEGEEKVHADGEQGSKDKPLSDDEILSNLSLLLIGDSVSLGATDEFYSIFPGSISDAAVSRQATESLGIYDSYVNGYGWNGEGVIFALGSNGLFYDSLGAMREMIGADRTLFLISIRAPYVSWEGSNNQEIYEFVESAENTYLIDWYKISEGHGEYFAGDGTHLTAEGIKAYVNGIKEAVLEVYRK